MIRTVFFDLGNVLLRVDKQRILSEFARLPGLSLPVVRRLAESPVEQAFEKGLIDTDEYIDRLNRECGLSQPITMAALIDIWQKPFEEIPDVCELIPVLKRQVRLILLSNTNELHIRAVRRITDILDEFDALVLSYEVRSRKPEAAIYHKALEIAGHDVSECLFVDDLMDNVRAARRLGIRSHRFTTISKLRRFFLTAGLNLN
ncbi:MAG: HAD family hydrolase [Fidelibacterota bacterium]